MRRQLPLHKGAVIIPDNQSFFCLVIKAKNRDEKSPLFFNYKICTIQLPKFLLPTFLSKEKYGQRKVRSGIFVGIGEAAFGGFAIAGIHILACAIHSLYNVIKRDLA